MSLNSLPQEHTSGHTIICDSREQNKLTFDHPEIAGVKICKLDIGDYAIRFEDGFIPPVYFQRKGIGDLFGSLTKGYSRIKEEIARTQANDLTLIIIIEGTLSKIFKGYRHSGIKGISIIKTLFSLWCRYGVIPVFVKDREEMSLYIINYYLAIWRKRISKESEE